MPASPARVHSVVLARCSKCCAPCSCAPAQLRLGCGHPPGLPHPGRRQGPRWPSGPLPQGEGPRLSAPRHSRALAHIAAPDRASSSLFLTLRAGVQGHLPQRHGGHLQGQRAGRLRGAHGAACGAATHTTSTTQVRLPLARVPAPSWRTQGFVETLFGRRKYFKFSSAPLTALRGKPVDQVGERDPSSRAPETTAPHPR